VLKQTNAQIVAVLESDSEVLARVQGSFHTLIRSRSKDERQSIEITCFFEELPLPLVGVVGQVLYIAISLHSKGSSQVVPSHSAILPGYIPIGIRSNHMGMTKFEDENDPGYTAVTGELRRWVKHITTHDSSGFASTAIGWAITYPCQRCCAGQS
jgi:hypothetical protein